MPTLFFGLQQSCSVKKVCLKIPQISQENTCVGISFCKSCSLRRLCNVIEKTPTQVFSSWICKTFKNIYFVEHLQIAVSGSCKHSIWTCFKIKDIDSTEFFRKIELPYPLSPPSKRKACWKVESIHWEEFLKFLRISRNI